MPWEILRKKWREIVRRKVAYMCQVSTRSDAVSCLVMEQGALILECVP